MKARYIHQRLLAAALCTALLPVALVNAKESEVTETGAYLRATLRNNPAMSPVSWQVFRLDNKSLVKTSSAHSLMLPLEPGEYKAVVSLNNVTRDCKFTVLDKSKTDVVIPLD